VIDVVSLALLKCKSVFKIFLPDNGDVSVIQLSVFWVTNNECDVNILQILVICLMFDNLFSENLFMT